MNCLFSDGNGIKNVKKKYMDSMKTLRLYWPKGYITIEDLSKGVMSIQLHSGEDHFFDEEEVRRLLSLVPSYFWKFMKIPIMLRYSRDNDGRAYYMVVGDVWQKRLVELLLSGDYGFNGISELTTEDFISMLRNFKSLIFVTVTT